MKRARKKNRRDKKSDILTSTYQDITTGDRDSLAESDIPFYVSDDIFESQTAPEPPADDFPEDVPGSDGDFSVSSIEEDVTEQEVSSIENYSPQKTPPTEKKPMKKKKKKKNRALRRFVTVLLCIFLLIVIAVSLLGSQLLTRLISGSKISEEDSIYEYMTEIDSSKIEKLEKINILLLGVDKDGERSDSIMLVNYNVNTHKINLISIPRDTRIYVEDRRTYRKITEVHGMHKKNGEMYGAAAVANAVIELTGMPINYYMEFSFDAVDSIMDILGPVTFDVPDLEGRGRGMNYDDPYQDLHIHLKPGIQQLSGNQIQQFLRYRKSNYGTVDGSDLNRVKRQQELLAAIMDQKLNAKLVTKIPDILDEVNEGLKTTFSSDDIVSFSAYLLKNLNNISSENMESHVLPGDTDMISGKSYFVCDLDATAELVNTVFGYEVDADELSNVINLSSQKPSGSVKTSDSKNTSSSKNSSDEKKSSSTSTKTTSSDKADDDDKETSKKDSTTSKKTSSDDDKDEASTETSKSSSTSKKDSSASAKKDSSESDEGTKKTSSDDNKKDDDTEKSDTEESKNTSSTKNNSDDNDNKESASTKTDSSKKNTDDAAEEKNTSTEKKNSDNDTDKKSSAIEID